MTREDQIRMNSMIDRYGADAFLNAFMTIHPDMSTSIKAVIDRSGSEGAARMLFNYIPAGGKELRSTGAAQLPSQKAATGISNVGVGGSPVSRDEFPRQGVGIIPSERQAVGTGSSFYPGMRSSITQQISNQLSIGRQPQAPAIPGPAQGRREITNLPLGVETPGPMMIDRMNQARDNVLSGLFGQGSPSGKQMGFQDVLAKEPEFDQTIDPYGFFDSLRNTSKNYGVPLELVMAMMKQESNFNPDAVSEEGAKGLLQLMSETAMDRGLVVDIDTDERLNPMKNINAGLAHMQWIKTNYKPKNLKSWLAAYNAGHMRLRQDQWKNMKEPREYAEKVSAYAKQYRDNPNVMAKDFLTLYKNIRNRGEQR